MAVTKKLNIIDSVTGDISDSRDIGAEAQNIQVSRDINGEIIEDITTPGVEVTSTESLTATLKNIQTSLTFDDLPVAGSSNPVKSSGLVPDAALSLSSEKSVQNKVITQALNGKMNTYAQSPGDWDTIPVENSTKPVTSGGIYQAIAASGGGSGLENIIDSPSEGNVGGIVENATRELNDYTAPDSSVGTIIPNISLGDFSHAEGVSHRKNGVGYIVTASGFSSHAEGLATSTIGMYSHAEGNQTCAYGSSSHTEGLATAARSTAAHAEGNSTSAIGKYSHAEGEQTKALDEACHAEGYQTCADYEYTHAEGYKTYSRRYGSHAEGWETTAGSGGSLQGSHAEGVKTYAPNGGHAEGNETTANGNFTHAEGYKTSASQTYSHAEGSYTSASGYASHAEGSSTLTTGQSSHAEGSNTQAGGTYSHAEGYITTASGMYSHAEGQYTKTENYCSHAEGYKTCAIGNASHAEGGYSNTINRMGVYAIGDNSHAEGCNTSAVGEDSHAEGFETYASGTYSHAEGCYSTASGSEGSHAEGNDTLASGPRSHAEGSWTTAAGNFSHAGGHGTIANYSQTVVGMENMAKGATSSYTADSGYFIVGSGNNSNCFRATESKTYGKTYATSGADYAEMFEWLDNNSNNEDRIGKFVTLDGNKIKLATSQDDYILGIVSGNASVIGDVYDDQWQGMFETDIFGRPIYTKQEHELEDGTKVYDDVLKVNPNYDNTQEYIPRSERSEWDAVGLLGKLICLDDGTGEVNGYVTVNDNSIATKAIGKTKYRVMKRIDENHIQIMIL